MNDIDNKIDWLSFYSKYLKNPKTCGQNKMHACCPFHEEHHPSFWFNTKNGCFKCEGCGESGNATVFLSKIKGISQSNAYKELAELAGVSGSGQNKSLDYTVEMYAAEKCFNSEWLKSEVGITNGNDRSGKFIKIPYKDRAGKTPIIFGDFSYYWIADRVGRSFKKLGELYAETDEVGFKATQRVDGKLILPEAVKSLKMATA